MPPVTPSTNWKCSGVADRALCRERERLLDVADLVALELRRSRRRADALAARSRICGRELTKTSSPKLIVPQLSVAISGLHAERLRALVDRHADGAAGRGLDDAVALLADGLDGLREALARLRVRAVGVAHVQVDDRRARLAAARGLVGDLLRR